MGGRGSTSKIKTERSSTLASPRETSTDAELGLTGIADLTEMSESDRLDKLRELQRTMGQTGLEAGDPDESPRNKLYVNTGKAWVINTYLTNDRGSYDTPGTDWDNLVDREWLDRAIRKLDRGMKPMSEDIIVNRYMDAEAADKMLGLGEVTSDGFNALINLIDRSDSNKEDFKNLLGGLDYTQKAYTSTTASEEHSSYDNYPVKLNMIISKGTPAIVTSNFREHEIVVGRNRKYKFTKNFYVKTLPSGKKQLVIDVIV